LPQAYAASTPAGTQEYYVLGNAENAYRVFKAVAQGEGKPLQPSTRGIESVLTLAASLDGQVIVLDHWEDGYDADPVNAPSPTTRRFSLSLGQPLDLKSTETSATGFVPVEPRGTALRYDGGDRIISIGGPVSLVHVMWPLKTAEMGDAWEVQPLEALDQAYFYTVPLGIDSFANAGGASGAYGGFKYVYLEIQATQDNTQITIANGQDPEIIVILDRGQSYSTLGYINGRPIAGTALNVYEGTTVLASEPVQMGMQTFGAGTYQNRFYNSVPDSVYGTDYVSQVRGTSQAPSQLYVFNPSHLDIDVTAYDLSVTSGVQFLVPAGSSVSYSESAGHLVPVGSGVRLMSDDQFYVLGAYDYKSRDFDWGYTPVPTYFLGKELNVPWAPQANADATNNPLWVASTVDGNKIRFDRNGDGVWDLIDLDGNGVADATHDPAGTEKYYLANVLSPLTVYDHIDGDATGMQIVAEHPISAAYGVLYDNSNERAGRADWGYTLLPMIRPWMKEVFAVSMTVDTRTVPSIGGTVEASFDLSAVKDGPVTGSTLFVSLPVGVSYVDGTGVAVLPNGTEVPLAPELSFGGLSFDVGSLVPALNRGQMVRVRMAMNVAGSAPRGKLDLSGRAAGWWGGVKLQPRVEFSLFKGALSVTKTATSSLVMPGSVFTYTLQVANVDSLPVTGVVLNDMIPPDLSLLAGSCGDCSYSSISRMLTWQIGMLLPGEVRTVTFDVRVKNISDQTIIGNEAFAFDAQGDIAYSNPVNLLIAAPILWLEKTVNAANVQVGDVITYRITFRNTGSETALAPIVTDPLPAGITYVPGSMSISDGAGWQSLQDGTGDDMGGVDGVYDAGSRTLEFSGVDLLPGAEYVLRFDVTVDGGLGDGDRIINSATLSSGNMRVRRSRSVIVEIGNGDTDCDGLTDAEEFNMGTDPSDPDTDADGLPDGLEAGVDAGNTNSSCTGFAEDTDTFTRTNPMSSDTDGDGLLDGEEDSDGNGSIDAGETNPAEADTDSDGLNDYVERTGNYTNGPTNPLVADTDGDTLLDGVEDANQNGQLDAGESDPTVGDTDGDGIVDGVELNSSYTNGAKTDPHNADSDGDGLSDGTEDANRNGIWDVGETDPTLFDTDGDGLGDGLEAGSSYGGGVPSDPTKADSDGDGLQDGEEDSNGNGALDGNETDPTSTDSDADGLSDWIERNVLWGGFRLTDPRNADTDGDGLADGIEDLNGDGVLDPLESDPTVADTDGDGLDDYLERITGNYGNGKTDPQTADTDGDGLSDGAEDANANGSVDAGETDPTLADTDGDGVPDNTDTNPTNPDSDGDGIPDGDEDTNGNGQVDPGETDPDNADTDGDGLSDYLEINVGSYGNGKTDPLNPDTDGDGLSDGAEDANANGSVDAGETDPTLADTDGDGVPDNTDTNPTNPDSDGDGIPDGDEDTNGNGQVDPGETDPNNADTDGDGLSDYLEINVGSYGNGKTDPLNPDTDGDSLSDGAEDANANGSVDAGETDPTLADTDGDGVPDNTDTNPTNPDSDGDGIPDGDEDTNGNGQVDPGETDPNNADTDGDGLSDHLEINVGSYGNGKTNPLNPDTDGDGLSDGVEDANANGSVDSGETDPTLADSDGDGVPDGVDTNPTNPDSDGDGIPDGVEDSNGNGQVDPGETDPNSADSDGDGLSDFVEIFVGNYGNGKTNPLNADSDGDGLLDGEEDANHNGSVDVGESDPTLADSDGDGIPDGVDTNPTNPDSDGDGIPDGEEDTNGNGQVDPGETDPNNADSDNDGLSDYVEIHVGNYGNGKTDPLNADTDGDMLPDGFEDANANGQVDPGETDPTLADSDGDGVPDNVDGNATNPDSDGDGLSDGEEDTNGNGQVDPGETDPNDADSDNDGLSDGIEVGSAYGNGSTDPLNPDSDGDGLLDGQEDINKNGLREPIETDPTRADTDADGLTDRQELSFTYAKGLKTNPVVADTDGDGLLDGEEDLNRDGRISTDETQPVLADTDGDRHSDGLERRSCYTNCAKTNPHRVDTDGDGLFDSTEDFNGNGRLDPGETDPTLADTDGDGIPDAQDDNPRVYGVTADATGDQDTDGGGVVDSREREAGTNIYDPDDDYLAAGGKLKVRGGGGCSTAGNGQADWMFILGGLLWLVRRIRVRLQGGWAPRVAAAGLAAAMLVTPANAADTTVSPQIFRPNTDGKGLLVTEGAPTLRQGKWTTGLYFNYASDPLVAETATGQRVGEVVGRIVGADLMGAFGVTEYIEIGAHLPMVINQYALEGDSKKFGFGDGSLWSKAAILTEEGGPFSLSALARVKFPTGDSSDFLGDGKWGGEVGAIFERHIGPVRGVANLGYRLRNQAVEYLNLGFRDELLYSIGAAVPENSRTYTLEFYGSTPAEDVFGSAASPLEVLLGFKQSVISRVDVEVGLGRGLTNGYGSPAFRAFSGVRFSTDAPEAPMHVPSDRDRDRIFDMADACPDEAEDFDAFEDEDGCPDLDNDKDKIVDASDKCPNEAEDIDGYEDEDGCKDDRFWVEFRFKVQSQDKQPVSFADVQLLEGGEVKFRGKSDENGIVSGKVASGTYVLRAGAAEYDDLENPVFFTQAKHAWALTLAGRPTNGFISASLRTTDGTIVPGLISIRPGNVKLQVDAETGGAEATLKPGKYTVVATAQGYETVSRDFEVEAGKHALAKFVLVALKKPAKPAKVQLTEKKIEITEQVKFVSGKATIETSSYPLLDEVAGIMKENPAVRVRIEGHTDNVGRASVNLKLSKQRADAVRDYLLARGIQGDRMIALGLGDSKPIAANDTGAGRATNRRVEFNIEQPETTAKR
jgi:uncharacterized repeat protein (TIGR01451 family)